MTAIKHARSGIATENLQEVLDAEASIGTALTKGQQQYCSPDWFADQCAARLPNTKPETVIDPQCGEGALINYDWSTTKFGIDLDNRLKAGPRIKLLTGNCVKAWDILDDLRPDLVFECANANPPFGKKWKLPNGKVIDSTKATWEWVTSHANFGYLIANHNTLVDLGIVPPNSDPSSTGYTIWKRGCGGHPWVFHYEVHKGTSLWKGVREELRIGVVFWKNPTPKDVTPYWEVNHTFDEAARVLEDEKSARPDFNIYLDHRGYLRTYLSVRSELKLKLTREQIEQLDSINDAHPLTLTTDKQTRDLMKSLVDCGIYKIQPEARTAIDSALKEVASLACPIMPVTPFESVAYADEEDELVCIKSITSLPDHDGKPQDAHFTAGKKYPIATGTYKFTDQFKRNKVHYDEATGTTYSKEHDCTLSGQDRYIQMLDDAGHVIRFMDRPRRPSYEFDESHLWTVFQQPMVQTICEAKPGAVDKNEAVLKSLAMLAAFDYYKGQITYLARVAAKDSGLIAAETGTGKTLMALSLIGLKSPERALIIAPQGTMRSSESDEEDADDGVEYSASQWIQEIHRFTPYLQVWEIFSYADYERILSLNGGKLPPGVYVSYYQAMFQNGAREKVPDSWTDKKLNEWAKAQGFATLPEPPKVDGEEPNPRHWCESIGREVNGIRSIIAPCLATQIADKFDMVLLDEAHVCFPGDTAVLTDKGMVPIRKIVERKLDVRVLSCNPASRVLEWKQVRNWIKHESNTLVKITHEHGELVCTPNHPIWNGIEWKRADRLGVGEELRVVRSAIHGYEASHKVLHKAVRLQATEALGVCAAASIQSDSSQAGINEPALARSKGAVGYISKSCGQPIQTTGNCSQDSPLETGESVSRSVIPNRTTHPGSEETGGSNPRLPNGVSSEQRAGSVGVDLKSKALVRSGHCAASVETGHRSGRQHAQKIISESARCQEGSALAVSRVVSVEVLEQGDFDQLTKRGEEGHYVYCLEVEDNHNFLADGVLVANCTNLQANVTQMLIRIQPKYRWALTATPIPNLITNLFSLAGWLAVPEWYKGDRRNAAFPFAREEVGSFNSTFLSTERDFTAEKMKEEAARKAGEFWRGKCEKDSPVISSPARLLKILNPFMAFISKEDVNPAYLPPEVVDVRVPMGKEQAALYAHYLNRGNVPGGHPLIRARRQTAWLRSICADPAGFTHGGPSAPKVLSNLNPKVIAVLELVRDLLPVGQVLIVSSRVGLTNTLQHRLAEAGIALARIDSTVPAEQHAAQANLFKSGKAQVCLMGLRCAASHSFDQCPHEIITSIDWSPGSYFQAIGRIDRVTNKVKKKVFCVLNQHSIEEVQWEILSTKGDAATICLRGERVPRGYRPVDPSEVLASAIDRFDLTGCKPESNCESDWPKLRDHLKATLH